MYAGLRYNGVEDEIKSLSITKSKTPCGIGLYLECLKSGKISGPGIIVTKASLKNQWAEEVKKFSYLTPCIVNSWNKLKKRKDAELVFSEQFEQADLFILNYETFADDAVREKLHSMNIEYIFLDEIHYIRNHEAKRSKFLCEFNYIKIKAGATATPVQHDPRDIYGIFKFLNPELFSKKSEFWRTFLFFNRFHEVAGSRNTKLLNEKIKPYVIIKTKEEVSSQLPSLVVIQRHLNLDQRVQEMSDLLMQEINDLKTRQDSMLKQFVGKESEMKSSDEFKMIEAGIQMRQTFAQEIADTPRLLEMSESIAASNYVPSSKYDDSKLDSLEELLEEIISSGEKVAIFSKYERMQSIIAERIKANKELKKAKIAYVNGKLSAQARYDEVYTKFRDNDDYKILLLSDAGAEGLNLNAARYLIEMELADSYAIQTQRHGRIERADSVHETVYVYQLIADNTWDEIQMKVVNKKAKFDAEIVHGKIDIPKKA